MNEISKKDDKSTWAIGGGLRMGLGVGFFFLKRLFLHLSGVCSQDWVSVL